MLILSSWMHKNFKCFIKPWKKSLLSWCKFIHHGWKFFWKGYFETPWMPEVDLMIIPIDIREKGIKERGISENVSYLPKILSYSPPPPNPHTPAFKKMENPLRILISNEGKHSLTLISFGRVSPVLTMWNEQNSRDATSSTTTIANVNKNNAQNKCGPHLFDQVLWWGSYV